MIEHVKEQTDNMLLTLAGLEQKISKLAEVSKRTDEIDKLEKEAIEAVHNCELSFTCEYESPEKQKEHIDAFFENITNEFSVFCFPKKYGSLIRGYDVQLMVEEFVKKLPGKIRTQLKKEAGILEYKVNINSFSRKLKAFRNLDCIETIEQLNKNIKPINGFAPKTAKYLTEIGSIPFSIPFDEGYFGPLCFDGVEIANMGEYYRKLYRFLKMGCHHVVVFFNSQEKSELIQQFRTSIELTRNVLETYFKDCLIAGNKALKPNINQIKSELKLDDIEQSIRTQADNLRKSAQISENEKKRLDYIQKLQERVKEFTDL